MINSGWRGIEMKCIANDSKCTELKLFQLSLHGTWTEKALYLNLM